MGDRQKRYNHEYYEQNKEKISERRKKKYYENAELREKTVKKSREYRKQQSAARGHADTRGRKPGPLAPRRIELAEIGKTVTAYSSGFVAKELGITVQTLRVWGKKGRIPVTPYWLSNGRWWTQRMLTAFLKAKADCGEVGVRSRKFPDFARKYWPNDEM